MVVAYPVSGKAKSVDICKAFVDGCGGRMGGSLDGPAFFFGVDGSNQHIWSEVKARGLPYLYCDNSYFDQTRGTHFRVTWNALQHSGHGKSDGKRFAALGIDIKPWRDGTHIVVCEQSRHFMQLLGEVSFDWLGLAIDSIRHYTRRPLIVRAWDANKPKIAKSLLDDLKHAHALVTWSSAAAVTAVLEGVPVVCMGPCVAGVMGGDVKDIENLPTPERSDWAGLLADNQWTLDEFRDGTAWRSLAS